MVVESPIYDDDFGGKPMIRGIDLPVEIAYRRKDDIFSTDYISKRRTMYLEIRKKIDVSILNGSTRLEELNSLICKEVIGHIGEF